MSKFRELALDVQKNLYDYTYAERMRYKNIYDVVEKYISEHKLFVSNIYKLTKLQRSTSSLINYHYDIYCDHPLKHANNLINKIYENIEGDPLIQYLNMNTSVKNEEFVITYDTRMVAKIFAIQPGYVASHKTASIGKTIVPVVIDSLQYLPPTVEIIDLYNILYTGNGYDEAILNITTQLAKMVTDKTGGDIRKIESSPNFKHKKVKSKAKLKKQNNLSILANDDGDVEEDVEGGDENDELLKNTVTMGDGGDGLYDDDGVDGGAEKTCYEKKKNELEAIKIALLRDYFKGRNDIILIGSIGYNWYHRGDNLCPNMERIQIITSIPIPELQHEITQYVNGIGRNYKIIVSDELGLMIPKDFRSKKTIFSMVIATNKGPKEKPFLEVFNNSKFELIPAFLSNDILIGSKYVLLRFLYIDLWIANFVYTIGKLTKEKYVERQKKILHAINNVSTIKNVADGVLGTYYDYAISKNELIFNQEQYFGPYNVDSYFKKNKKLRTI